MTNRRTGIKVVVLTLLVAVVAGLGVPGARDDVAQAATAAPALSIPGPIVPKAFFGLTVQRLGSISRVPLPAGSLRLWDVGVRWDQLEPQNGVYNWAPLDKAVATAWNSGIRDLLFTLGSTPAWARTPAPASVEANDLYGPGTASYPYATSYFTTFLKALAIKYKGRITSFEMWNEANLKIFYRGTPAQLAYLTKRAYAVVKLVSPANRLVAASTVVGPYGPGDPTFYASYLRYLKYYNGPVDAYAGHFYIPPTWGPNTRGSEIFRMKAFVAKYGVVKPLWDTETNYGYAGVVNPLVYGTTAAAYVARAYIDSMRFGLARTYWYSWEVQFLRVRLSVNGVPTSAAVAYRVLRSWMVGKHWTGCTTFYTYGVRCGLTDIYGHRFSLWYSTKGSVSVRVPYGTGTMCKLSGAACTPLRGGTWMSVGLAPFLTGGA